MKLQGMRFTDDLMPTPENRVPDNTIYFLPADLKEEIANAVINIAAQRCRNPESPEANKMEEEIKALIQKRAKECVVIKNVGL